MPSDLQVSNIKDLTGSNTGLSIASDGQVTIAQNNPTITLGANASGFTGVKTVDVWLLNQDISTSSSTIQSQYLTRATTSEGGANLGTGVTLNGTGTDAGIFTFPSTGIWRVESILNFSKNGDSRYIFSDIYVSTTGTSGTFAQLGRSRTHINHTSSGTTQANTYTTVLLDVTTSGTSGTAVRFDITSISSISISGDSNLLESWFIFTRLGDT